MSIIVIATLSTLVTILLIALRWLWVDCHYWQGRATEYRNQYNDTQNRATQYACRSANANEQLRQLREDIGTPEGVVFLPEKSYYEDYRALKELCEKYAKLHQEKHQKLVSIWNFLGGPSAELLKSETCNEPPH